MPDLGNNCSKCYGDKGKGTSLCWNLRGLELLNSCKTIGWSAGMHALGYLCVRARRIHMCTV